MYGLIEAAEQIRTLGHLKAAHGAPATPLRAVRLTLAPGEIDQPWFSSDQFWRGYFQTLARSRINRFGLAVPRLPDPPNRLRGLSQLAAYYGIDFILALPEPSGDPLLLRARLVAILAACPQIRGIEMDAATAPVDLFRDEVLGAIGTAGRRVTLDLRNASTRRDLHPILDRAAAAGLALRISSPSGCKELSDLPEGSCFWALREPASADAESVRARVADWTADGSLGFEIETPRTDSAPDAAVQTEHSFYFAWGRTTYDPKPPPAPPKPAPVATPNRKQ
jgi:hypothetical protein